MIILGIKWDRNPTDYQSGLGRKYGKLDVIRYTNSSYTNDINDKKLIIRYCFFFIRGIVT